MTAKTPPNANPEGEDETVDPFLTPQGEREGTSAEGEQTSDALPIQVVEHSTYDEARAVANQTANNTSGLVYPCIVGHQGGRTVITAQLPYGRLAKMVYIQPAKKGESVRDAANRPIIKEHVRAIKNYLLANEKHHTIPPVMLNVRDAPSVHVERGPFAFRIGYLVMTEETVLYATDGQHRILAIRDALLERRSLANHTCTAHIIIEGSTQQIHQDFADAARTKPIPPSMLAVYNTREPVNRVLELIVARSRILRGRVNESGRQLPKNSYDLFVLNGVRQFVKNLLAANTSMGDAQLQKHADRELATPELQHEFVRRALLVLDTMTEYMTPWGDIAKLPLNGPAAARIVDLRGEYVNLTTTGLNVIGRVAYDIFKAFPTDEYMQRTKLIELANRIDWRKSAAIWQGKIFAADGHMLTSRVPVDAAAAVILPEIGLSMTRLVDNRKPKKS